MNNDLISRKYLKEAFNAWKTMDDYYHRTDCVDIPFSEAFDLIDNAPAVDTSDAKYLEERDADAYESGYLQGHVDGYKKAESDYQKGGADMMQEAAP